MYKYIKPTIIYSSCSLIRQLQISKKKFIPVILTVLHQTFYNPTLAIVTTLKLDLWVFFTFLSHILTYWYSIFNDHQPFFYLFPALCKQPYFSTFAFTYFLTNQFFQFLDAFSLLNTFSFPVNFSYLWISFTCHLVLWNH